MLAAQALRFEFTCEGEREKVGAGKPEMNVVPEELITRNAIGRVVGEECSRIDKMDVGLCVILCHALNDLIELGIGAESKGVQIPGFAEMGEGVRVLGEAPIGLAGDKLEFGVSGVQFQGRYRGLKRLGPLTGLLLLFCGVKGAGPGVLLCGRE